MYFVAVCRIWYIKPYMVIFAIFPLVFLFLIV